MLLRTWLDVDVNVNTGFSLLMFTNENDLLWSINYDYNMFSGVYDIKAA